jgi:hypothetical protein
VGSEALTFLADISVTGTALATGDIALHGIPTVTMTTATVATEMTTTAALSPEGAST